MAAATTEATPSPHKTLGSLLLRAVVSSHSLVKLSPLRTDAQRSATSPFTRSGKARAARTTVDLFDMSTQVME